MKIKIRFTELIIVGMTLAGILYLAYPYIVSEGNAHVHICTYPFPFESEKVETIQTK